MGESRTSANTVFDRYDVVSIYVSSIDFFLSPRLVFLATPPALSTSTSNFLHHLQLAAIER